MDPLQVDEALRSTLSALKLELSKPSCDDFSQLADSDQPQSISSDTAQRREDSSTSKDNPSGNTSERDEVWPTLCGFQTQFENEKWKCPFCGDIAYRIEAHLKKTHNDKITNWDDVEIYCEEIRDLKRKGYYKKCNQKPKRKEAEKIRNQQPERKEYQR